MPSTVVPSKQNDPDALRRKVAALEAEAARTHALLAQDEAGSAVSPAIQDAVHRMVLAAAEMRHATNPPASGAAADQTGVGIAGADHEAAVRGIANYARDMAVSRAELASSEATNDALSSATSELVRSQAALRRSEARLRALSETIPQLVWTSRADGHWDWSGPQWQAYTGHSEADSLGRGWLAMVHPDDRAHTLAAWRMATAAGCSGGLDVEHRLWRAGDGTWRWFQTRAVPLPAHEAGDEPADGLRWFGTCTDIDDLKRAEERLKRLNETLEAEVAQRSRAQTMEAVGQLTGGIAHDVNNMLQSIGGSLELIQRRVEQGRTEEIHGYVDVARGSVERAAGLIHRLLGFARRQALDPRPVILDPLITGLEERFRRTLGLDTLVEINLHDGTWPVLCDVNQLESVLINLAINSRDAMPQGGRFTVTTIPVALGPDDVAGQEGARPGSYVEITVADTGVGMTPNVMARAFEPFFTTKPIGHGAGLGLSHVYGFVRQSGGVARLESTPGQGTRVRLYLPQHEQVSSPTATRDVMEPEPDSAEVILLVEDEKDVRELVAESLRELGYAVLEAEDGTAALRVLQSAARVDVLVTDVGLPGLNGRQVADAAREGRPGLPVLFITGYAGGAVVGMLPAGMAVLGKPFVLNALTSRIKDLIAQA